VPDTERIRADFPILRQRIRGKPLVYLDSAATSQKPQAVIDAVVRFYVEQNSNVHRGVHALAERATSAYEKARDRVSAFIGSPGPECTIWTRGTTEGINLVAYSWARKNLRPGDEILISLMEHHSNLVPWQLAAAETGAVLKFIPVTDDYTLDMDAFHRELSRKTRLVAVTHMSNVLGTINPVREICAAAHRVEAKVMVDGAQAVAHFPVDVSRIDCDFYAFSGHKMMGPTGIGVLYGKKDLLDSMPPFHGGGEMITEVKLERSKYKPVPYKFEAGTPPIAEAVGLGAAVDYLSALGMDAVRAHEETLAGYALSALAEVDGLRVFGPATNRGGVISFQLDGLHAHDLATILDSEGIAVRAGHHCAQPLMERLGVPATTRASLYVYNRRDEVDALIRALEKAKGVFGIASRAM
jgi:cysteine desulfurase/selenocysteine lyase